jgi:hypothetical protein
LADDDHEEAGRMIRSIGPSSRSEPYGGSEGRNEAGEEGGGIRLSFGADSAHYLPSEAE